MSNGHPSAFYNPNRFLTCRGCNRDLREANGVSVEFQDFGVCLACADASRERAKKKAAASWLASVPASYRWATFESPELKARITPASVIPKAKACSTGSVVLVGKAGSGKTSLAVAIAHERMLLRVPQVMRARRPLEYYAASAVFVTSMAIAKARSQHKLGDGEPELITDALGAELLVLDEVGADIGRDTSVAELIHERHAEDLPTIFTTPFTIDELAVRYSDGIARRVFERCTVIRLGVK